MQNAEDRFANASYKINPRIAKSAIHGTDLPVRTTSEREDGRRYVGAKLREENAAMQEQRERIEALHAPTFALSAANDNIPNYIKAAA